jgi:hypothetical protein
VPLSSDLIFTIHALRTRFGGRGNSLRLRANVLSEVIALIKKKVRNLKIINFRVPVAIDKMSYGR